MNKQQFIEWLLIYTKETMSNPSIIKHISNIVDDFEREIIDDYKRKLEKVNEDKGLSESEQVWRDGCSTDENN